MSIFNGLEDEDGHAKGTRTEKPGTGGKVSVCRILKSQWEVGRGSVECCFKQSMKRGLKMSTGLSNLEEPILVEWPGNSVKHQHVFLRS